MKKFIFSLILILICFLSVSVCAENEIFHYSFTAQQDADAWPGCFFDSSLNFGKGFSAFVTNPFGEVKNDTITHVIDYSDKVYLEAGKIYTLSGYVMNPLNDANQQILTSANLESGANTVIVTVHGANSEWQLFTTTFYSGQTGYFNLSIHFTEGNEDFGFFVDEFTLKENNYTLTSLGVTGASEIMIPINTVSKNSYIPYLIASDSTRISILSDSSIVSSCSTGEGIEYDPQNFTLSISNTAKPNTQITIDFALENYANLSLYSFNVTLTDNMIDNSYFDEDTLYWQSSSLIDIVKNDSETYIGVSTNDYGDYGYYSTVTYSEPQLLLGGELYVLRAKVKSDSDITERTIYAKNTSAVVGNTVFFEIKDISGAEWKEVFAAFIPEVSGVYDISVNLCSMYDSTIFIDDITLTSEALKPEYLTLHAPGNIAIPDVTTAYPVYAYLRDQLGNIIDEYNISLSLESDNSSLLFNTENNSLVVFPDTLQGVYILNATYNENPSIRTSLPVTVSFDYVGDGGFEQTVPNEWWTATSPYECNFYIRNDGYSKRALINSDGEYLILLNNSYIHLIENVPYVFNCEFSGAKDCTVTLFIESIDSNVYPLVQFQVAGGTTLNDKLPPELFLAEESVVGRLFLYIQSNDSMPFSIYADNLSLKKASIMAANPHVTGNLYVNGAAEAQFSFYNSVTQDNDISSCIVNWYISSDLTGTYTMLENFDANIYFDTTFYNKYVYFEVIPVCPSTGFSGDAVRSTVYHITSEENSQSVSQPEAFIIPELDTPTNSDFFDDTKEHWAKNYIDELAFNKIVNGVSKNIFLPDKYITRAEFAKLLCNAFSVKKFSELTQFSDISKSDWFYSDVCALSQHGIINGISSEAFAPSMEITRQDAVVMIMRMYDKLNSNYETSNLDFYDSVQISSYAYSHIQSALSLQIVNGNPDGKFLPKNNITRAEASTLVYRMIKSL